MGDSKKKHETRPSYEEVRHALLEYALSQRANKYL